jgi:hypothetical protein
MKVEILCLFALLTFSCFMIAPINAYSIEIYPIYDGYMARASADSTLTSISTGVGTASGFTGATSITGFYTGAATIANNFSEERKQGYTFDLINLPIDANITSAYLRIVPSAKTVTLGTPQLIIVPFSPDNKLAYATSDYNKFDRNTTLSAYKPSLEIVAGYEILQPLNTNGINYVESAIPTRYVSLGLVTDWDITLIPTGLLWGTSRSAIYTIYNTEQIDQINDPKLIITYTSAIENGEGALTGGSSAGVQQEQFFSTINLWILVLLALIFVLSAIFIRLPLLAFIGTLFCLIGIGVSVNTNFITGFIFIIMTIVSLFVGFSDI